MTKDSFFRTEMLPESPPPRASAGIGGWLYKNLFKGWLNTALTILSCIIIFWLLSAIIPWLLSSIWSAKSLRECREIAFVTFGTTHGSACWAVINERWMQLLYGFYPNNLYWRPNLALLILIVGILPILFDKVSRKLYIVTIISPFVIPWLMWGGAFWLPVLAFLSLPIGYLTYRIGKSLNIEPFFITPAVILTVALWFFVGIGAISHAIEPLIAKPKLQSQLATEKKKVVLYSEKVENLQEQIEDYQSRIVKVDREKNTLFKEFQQKKRSNDTSESELESLKAPFLEKMRSLYELKRDQEAVRRIFNNEKLKLSYSKNMVQRISSYENNRAIFRETNAEIADLKTQLGALGKSETYKNERQTLTEKIGALEEKAFNSKIQIAYVHKEVGSIGLKVVESRNFGGFMLAVIIGVVAIACSLPIGIFLALGRQSDLLIIKYLSIWFIEFIRGVPLITLLLVASTLLNIFFPPDTNLDIISRVMIMVTFFASAYMAEIIRGGMASLSKGQYEGASSLGLSYWQSQRLIIMPQALKVSIPGIVSSFIGVFKDTTLVSIIGLLDPLGLSNSIRADTAWNGIYWELFIFIAILFFICCFSMSRYSLYLEKKLKTDNS